jgi:hypothetical protein
VTTGTIHGIPRHSEARSAIPATSRARMDAAIGVLAARRRTWAGVGVGERVEILDGLLADFAGVSDDWVAASLLHKGLEPDQPASGEEWSAGPFCILRNIRLLRDALADVAAHGTPRIPGPVWTRGDGGVVAGVFPVSVWDRLFYAGVSAEVWMQPGVTAAGLRDTQALAYRGDGSPSKVALVLGAGNVSSIGPRDALYKLFVENHVVLYKAHPVNDYLGPLMERAFRRLVDRDVLRIVYGGAAEGAYLCQHPGVEAIHITGSDKTYEAIVFGTGPEGERRRAEGRPALTKPVSAELGNVSPVIVVPGPWSAADIRYHAVNLTSMLTNNAGFNCNATRVIIQHAGWPQRSAVLDAIRGLLAKVPARRAYYPGSAGRDAEFRGAHPEAERFGDGSASGALPWTLIAGLDPNRSDDLCYHTEAFCGLFAETALEAAGVVDYVERAVRFCNETLWGTLNATILVHPKSLADPGVRDAVERAIAGLRYGSVSVNHWAAISYVLCTTTWGAWPGHAPGDIQSGTGVVHNTLMFSRPEKSVVRAPFRVWPLPPWFVTNRVAHRLLPKLARFEARPSTAKAVGVFATAVRG